MGLEAWCQGFWGFWFKERVRPRRGLEVYIWASGCQGLGEVRLLTGVLSIVNIFKPFRGSVEFRTSSCLGFRVAIASELQGFGNFEAGIGAYVGKCHMTCWATGDRRQPHRTRAATPRPHHCTPPHPQCTPHYTEEAIFLVMERDSAKTPTQHRFSQNFTDLHVKTCEDL